MNYLAHSYLNGSQGNQELMGNMMGDFVKGNQYLQYNEAIQQGIKLHRAIDTFTDAHPIISETKNYFRKDYGLYSGAIVDVLWDYFLANDSTRFANDEKLKLHIQNTYNTIINNSTLMNDKMKTLTSYMIQYDWLYNYKFKEGIFKSWQGMSKRLEKMNDAEFAIEIFNTNETIFKKLYFSLIADLENEFIGKIY